MSRTSRAIVVAVALGLVASVVPAGASAGEPSAATAVRKHCKRGYKVKNVKGHLRCVRNHKGSAAPSAKTTYSGDVEGLSGVSFVRTCSGTSCYWFLNVTVPLGPGCNAAMMNGPGTETASGGLTGTIGATDVRAKVTGTFTAAKFTGKVVLTGPLPAACAAIPKTSFSFSLPKS